jgi:hypothetical protein
MTQLLWFKRKWRLNESPNTNKILVQNFLIANKLIHLLTIGWLFYIGFKYQIYSNILPILFQPASRIPELILPTFPSIIYFGTAWFVCLILLFLNFNLKLGAFLKFILFIILAWLNLIQFGYGYLSHTSHIMLLFYFNSIFIQISDANDFNSVRKQILYLHLSILMTYTLAGFWKLSSLIYKILFQPHEFNWLHPLSFLTNAIVSYRIYDLDFAPFFSAFMIPYFWQIAYLLMVFIQLFAVFAAFNIKIQPYFAVLMVIFHALNAFLFKIVFIMQPMIILLLFFPYHFIHKNSIKQNLSLNI